MSIEQRAEKVIADFQSLQRTYPMDLESYTDDQLKKYIKDSVERTHKENQITDCASGIKYYEQLFEDGNIPTEDELKSHLETEKAYWNNEFN